VCGEGGWAGAHVYPDSGAAVGHHVGRQHCEVATAGANIQEGVAHFGAEGLHGQGIYGGAVHQHVRFGYAHRLVVEPVLSLS
jgi:hypothetical protein